MLLCLVFDNTNPTQKIVFSPAVDKFTSLQVKGMYTKFAAQTTNSTVTAVSNGIQSAPSLFKLDLGGMTAPILNLQVTLKDGVVTALDWYNSCNGGQGCEPENCK